MTDPAFELYRQTKEYHIKLREASRPNYRQLEEDDAVIDKYLDYCRIRREKGAGFDEFVKEFKTWSHEDKMAWFLGDTATPLVLSYSLMAEFNREQMLEPGQQAMFVPLRLNKLNSLQLFDYLLSLAEKPRTSIINNSIASPILRRTIAEALSAPSFERFEHILADSGKELEPFIKNTEYLCAIAPPFLVQPSEEITNLPEEELEELVGLYVKSIEIHDPDSGRKLGKLDKWFSQKMQYVLGVMGSDDLSSAWDVAIIYLVLYILNRERCDSVEKEIFDGFLDNPLFPELRPLCEKKAAIVQKELDELDEDTEIEQQEPHPSVQLPDSNVEGTPNVAHTNVDTGNRIPLCLPEDFFKNSSYLDPAQKKIAALENFVIEAGPIAFAKMIDALATLRFGNGGYLKKPLANRKLVASILSGRVVEGAAQKVEWRSTGSPAFDLEVEKVIIWLTLFLFKKVDGKYKRAYELLNFKQTIGILSEEELRTTNDREKLVLMANRRIPASAKNADAELKDFIESLYPNRPKKSSQ